MGGHFTIYFGSRYVTEREIVDLWGTGLGQPYGRDTVEVVTSSFYSVLMYGFNGFVLVGEVAVSQRNVYFPTWGALGRPNVLRGPCVHGIV